MFAMDRAQICAQANGALPAFLRSFCASPGSISARHDEGGELHLTPEQLEYLRQLIAALYEGRAVVASYNVAILFIILALTFWHWRETIRDRRKWRQISQSAREADRVDSLTCSSSSSSSSTAAGVVTPPKTSKDDRDVERLPLLSPAGGRGVSNKSKRKMSSKFTQSISSFLAYQPAPIPIINRTLPSNGTTLFILTWLGISLFFHLYRLPMRWDFFFIFADRAGCHFIVNLPLLYLLGAKNQPLRLLTGYSYEALNIFHRRVGELICLEAAVHFVSMVVYQFFIAEEWLLASKSVKDYFTHPLIVMGLAAFTSYELLFFTSLGSFRQRWYELFLVSHVFLQAGALVFLWFHFKTSQPYVAVSLLIFLTDRLVWRFGLKRASVAADLTILDEETFLVSADWDISSADASLDGNKIGFLARHSVLHGWEPTDHVFLTVPALGRSHALQAHPFTIASAAPGRVFYSSAELGNGTDSDSDSVEGRQKPRHAWLSLLIRAHDGFTADLLRHAESNSRVPVQLDGPYGSPHALSMLRASRCAMLVAGGSGIAVTFPLVWALLHEEFTRQDEEEEDGKVHSNNVLKQRIRERRRKVYMLWVTHSRCHRDWIPREQLDELVARGLELIVPEPTVEKGRPDVSGIVGGWLEGATDDTSVVVSGPDGLNRVVRNLCADAIGGGKEVRIAVEKFGW
ncbi:hypothetical protein QBC44DRAFT_317703 [Cladorrhinum sp. PSN332]|nr:hypothetical protein QBC44DRAFT_317703 [Cladorrhinum sp. PSN332]